jgi:hypothetical protein
MLLHTARDCARVFVPAPEKCGQVDRLLPYPVEHSHITSSPLVDECCKIKREEYQQEATLSLVIKPLSHSLITSPPSHLPSFLHALLRQYISDIAAGFRLRDDMRDYHNMVYATQQNGALMQREQYAALC